MFLLKKMKNKLGLPFIVLFKIREVWYSIADLKYIQKEETITKISPSSCNRFKFSPKASL